MYNDSNQNVIAFTEKGAVYSWGFNSNGSLGLQNNNNSPILAPSPIQNGLAGVRITQVSCGYLFSLALSNNGEVSDVYKHFRTCNNNHGCVGFFLGLQWTWTAWKQFYN